MRHLLLSLLLLIGLVSRAQVVSFDIVIFRGNTAERTLILPAADSNKVVTAVAKFAPDGRLLPRTNQPILQRKGLQGTVVIVRFQNTSDLPDAGYLQVLVDGRIRAAGRITVNRSAVGALPGSAVSATGVDLSAVYSLLEEKVNRIPSKGLSTLDFTPGYRGKLDSLAYYLSKKANLSSVISQADADQRYKPAGYRPGWADIQDKPGFFSGSYNDLRDRPAVPTTAGQLGAYTTAEVNQLLGSKGAYVRVASYDAMLALRPVLVLTLVLVINDERNNPGHSSEYHVWPTGEVMWQASQRTN